MIKRWNETHDVLDVREFVLKNYYSPNWTNVTINLSFILLSLLACENSFDKAICTAVSLGYDADCTGATVGSIFGIINHDGIGEKWTKPIGNALVLSAGVINMHAKNTVDDFCDQIISVATNVQEYYKTGVEINVPSDFPKAKLSNPYMPNGKAIYDWQDGAKESIIAVNPFLLTLAYPDSVAAIPNKENKYVIRLDNYENYDIDGEVSLILPDYWTATPENIKFVAKKGERIELPFTVKPDGKQKRMPLNILAMRFTVNGMTFTFEAGLPITYQWLKENLDTGEKEIYEAASVFFPVPKGRYKYSAKIFSPMGKDVRIHASSERKFKFYLNGNELYDSSTNYYGTFYSPTFHRSGYINTKIERRDNLIEVEFLNGEESGGEFYMGFSTIYGCAVWIDTFERRNFD